MVVQSNLTIALTYSLYMGLTKGNLITGTKIPFFFTMGNNLELGMCDLINGEVTLLVR